MGALARFLLILDKLVKSGVINKIPQAIKFAKNEFGEVTPLLKKQIENIFAKIKKPVVGKPGKKEGTVLPLVRDAKKVEGIETLDDFNLSKDDPMGDLEKIIKGEGDTGLPSRFTEQEIDAAIDNVSPGFSGDMKVDAELVADDLAQERFDKDFYDLDQKQQIDLYGRVFDRLSKTRMQKEVAKTDELMDFFVLLNQKNLLCLLNHLTVLNYVLFVLLQLFGPQDFEYLFQIQLQNYLRKHLVDHSFLFQFLFYLIFF